MKNKQILIAGIPFGICVALIGIVGFYDLIDIRIEATLMFICIGCGQFFIGLKFYKEDKKSRIGYILIGIGCFAFALFMLLKHL